MKELGQWTVREHLGRDWAAQVVWRDGLGALPAVPLAVVDEEDVLYPAQVGAGGRVYYPLVLRAGATGRLRLVEAEVESALTWSVTGNVLECVSPGLAFRLAWGEGEVKPPLVGLCGVDGVWFGDSTWDGVHFESMSSCILEAGPVRLSLRQHYKGERGALTLKYSVDCLGGALRWNMHGQGALAGDLILQLGASFRPQMAYWRPHSPTPARGAQGEYKRQVYPVRYDGDCIGLGPFYNWQKDAASFWVAWRADARRDALYIGCVRPAQTATAAPYKRVAIAAQDEGICARFALQEGEKSFALALLDRGEKAVRTAGAPNVFDALHRRLNGPGLDDYCQMTLDWAAAQGLDFPRLWIGASQLATARARFAQWPWLREQFERHADLAIVDTAVAPDLRWAEGDMPTLGRDPAGAYLATGDERYAEEARGELVRELAALVEILLDYGPSVDEAVGIALARRWRTLVLNLDLVLCSNVFSEAERAELFTQLAFVAEVSSTDDAWPATASGIERGNANFHPDLISARGLAATFLHGHPRQEQWLAEAVGEMRAFLHSYHLDSGVGREAATYQFCVLSYALQFDAALRRRGRAGLLTDEVFRASFDFLAAQQTPVDVRCGHRMLPTLGHVTSYAWCQTLQAYFAWAAGATAESAPEFSARMMAAWRRGGAFVLPLHDFFYGRIWSLPLCLLDDALPETADDDFFASKVHAGFGAVLRTRHADGSEGYVAFKMGECSGHYDNDEGSLIWYAYGQPLLADFGCQYNPNFHAHPWLHNRISIDHRADGPPRGGRLLCHRSLEGIDYVCGEVRVQSLYRETEWPVRARDFDYRQVAEEPQRIDEHVWRRHLLYVHAWETLVLWDEVEGTLPTDWNIQVHAEKVRIGQNSAHFRGSFGVDLSVLLFEPEQPDLEIAAYSHQGFDEARLPMGWWRAAAWTSPPGLQMTAMGEQALTLRAHAGPGQRYGAVLAAHRHADPAPRLSGNALEGVHIASDSDECSIRLAGDCWHVKGRTKDGTTDVELALARA